MPTDRRPRLSRREQAERFVRALLATPDSWDLVARSRDTNAMAQTTIDPEEVLYAEGPPADPVRSPGVGPRRRTSLTDSERDVAEILLASTAGLSAKEVAGRLRPRADRDAVAMRLRRMRRAGLVERADGGGFRLTAHGRAVAADGNAGCRPEQRTEQGTEQS